MQLFIGIIGLGLIGGSFAKAIKQNTPHLVAGFDIAEDVMEQALAEGAIDMQLDNTVLARCDLLLTALYPQASIEAVAQRIPLLKKGCVVADLCGVKRVVCAALDKPCRDAGLVFVGAHPMAGREFSGYAYTLPTLFKGASLIVTPTRPEDAQTARALTMLQTLARETGFGRTVVTTPEHHDKMIAYTSQLAHVLSNAYVKSPRANEHAGYSAGSFKDVTRVAKLNETMWAELFLDNADHLGVELDLLIANLSAYRDALQNGDRGALRALLREGREIKERL